MNPILGLFNALGARTRGISELWLSEDTDVALVPEWIVSSQAS